jgi:cytochrome c-type biogenesis protein CcmH/NrfF
VEILLWLVPTAVVTVVAMLWVAWLGREGRGEVDRDVAVQRLSAALQRERPAVRRERPAAPPDRSTGIAVRPSRARRSA